MDGQEYCESVEQKYRQHKKDLPNTSIKENNSKLVSLLNSNFNLIFEPSIKRDYKYMIREVVSEKIGRISKLLDKVDKKLIIRSVWRSFDHQRLLWEGKVNSLTKDFPNKESEEITELVSYFIAPPTKSLHSTGGSVDALIYDLKNNLIMDFGTNNGYNIELNDKCYPYHPHISKLAKENRKLLIGLFEDEDFVVDLKEYWHFDYGNAAWALEKGEKYAFYDVIKER